MDYCNEYFKECEFSEHKQGDSNIVDKEFFILIFKSMILWKQLRFKPIEQACIKKRRAAYFNKKGPNMEAYKNAMMEK